LRRKLRCLDREGCADWTCALHAERLELYFSVEFDAPPTMTLHTLLAIIVAACGPQQAVSGISIATKHCSTTSTSTPSTTKTPLFNY
jgi:hypothetical protein